MLLNHHLANNLVLAVGHNDALVAQDGEAFGLVKFGHVGQSIFITALFRCTSIERHRAVGCNFAYTVVVFVGNI